jgi:hypothetical protein
MASYTGAQVPPKRVNQIVAMLCAGESVNRIHKATGAHEFTIRAIQFKHASKIEEQKRIVADSALEGASESLAKLRHKINCEDLPANTLVPVFGVLIDKAIALRSDGIQHIQINADHRHIHAHVTESSWQDILSKAKAIDDQPNASPTPQDQ